MENEKVEKRLIKYYSSTLRSKPDSYIFIALADSYKRRGMYDTAIEICKRGLKLHTKYMSARALLGELYFISGELDKAEKELKEVAVNTENNIKVRKLLIDIYMKNSRLEDALVYSNELLNLSPVFEPFKSLNNKIKDKISKPKKNSDIKNSLDMYDLDTKNDSVKKEGGFKNTISDLGRLYTGLANHNKDSIEHLNENFLDDTEALNEIVSLFAQHSESSKTNSPCTDDSGKRPLDIFEKMLFNIKDVENKEQECTRH